MTVKPNSIFIYKVPYTAVTLGAVGRFSGSVLVLEVSIPYALRNSVRSRLTLSSAASMIIGNRRYEKEMVVIFRNTLFANQQQQRY